MSKEECYIKITPNEVEIYADYDEAEALLGVLVHRLKQDILSEEDIKIAVELGLAEECDLDKKAAEIIKKKTNKSKAEILKKLEELLDL